MKKIVVYLSALLAVGGSASVLLAEPPPTPGATKPAASRPRIALVNIAKVLKEFNKANQEGLAISKKRQEYFDMIKPMRERLAELSRNVQAATSETIKLRLKEEALTVNRQIEDLERRAQGELAEKSDQVIVEVYKQIKLAINDIAQLNDLDLVLCYPDASDEKDETKPAIAQLKLQTPALTPFYHRGMDITNYVIQTLNARNPAPKPEAPGNANPPKQNNPAPAGPNR